MVGLQIGLSSCMTAPVVSISVYVNVTLSQQDERCLAAKLSDQPAADLFVVVARYNITFSYTSPVIKVHPGYWGKMFRCCYRCHMTAINDTHNP